MTWWQSLGKAVSGVGSWMDASTQARRRIVDGVHGPITPETPLDRRAFLGRFTTATTPGSAYALATDPRARQAALGLGDGGGELLERGLSAAAPDARAAVDAAGQRAQEALQTPMSRRSFLGVDRWLEAGRAARDAVQQVAGPTAELAGDIKRIVGDEGRFEASGEALLRAAGIDPQAPVSRRSLLRVDDVKEELGRAPERLSAAAGLGQRAIGAGHTVDSLLPTERHPLAPAKSSLEGRADTWASWGRRMGRSDAAGMFDVADQIENTARIAAGANAHRLSPYELGTRREGLGQGLSELGARITQAPDGWSAASSALQGGNAITSALPAPTVGMRSKGLTQVVGQALNPTGYEPAGLIAPLKKLGSAQTTDGTGPARVPVRADQSLIRPARS